VSGCERAPRYCLARRFPYHRDSVRLARSALGHQLHDLGLPPQVVGDAELVLDELMANAIRHGQPDDRGDIKVVWCLGQDDLMLSVWDAGHVTGLCAQHASPDQAGGRGLAIVEGISQVWSVDNSDGTCVTAELAVS
jgi:serine/threonine-protein kinase RsbW